MMFEFIMSLIRFRKMRPRMEAAREYLQGVDVEYATLNDILPLVCWQPAIPPDFWGPVAIMIQSRCGRGTVDLDKAVAEVGRRFR